MVLFCGYKEFISLPDISKWKAINVKTMNSMFCYFYLLKSLPDISNCNTLYEEDMGMIFCDCSSLL